jgi:aspartyl-tRNA(Asn)/glutamyl-tRNA(Gln) amidotransferase subunit A
MATSVADLALTMEAIGKFCPQDATSLNLPSKPYLKELKKDLKGITFGIPWHFLEGLDPEIEENFKKSIEVLQSLGAKMVEIDLSICKHSIAVYYILATAEASTNLARFDGIRYGTRSHRAETLDEVYDLSREEGFGLEVKKRIMLGTYVLSAGYQDALYKKAVRGRSLFIDSLKKIFKMCDSILLPVSPRTAFPLNSIQNALEMYLQDIFTIFANLGGNPAISIPCGFKQKLPLGLQMVGPHNHDSQIMQYAHAFEMATRYTQKIPPQFQE